MVIEPNTRTGENKMNEKQRSSIQIIRRKIGQREKIRSEAVYIFEFGGRVLYEIETGSRNPINQHCYQVTVGPKGGISEKKVF